MSWTIRYTYLDPCRAGPYKGKMTVTQQPTKGDQVFAPFGRAIITSVSRTKE
jgi:hypothetical protein